VFEAIKCTYFKMWDGQWTKWEFAQFEESLEAKQEMEKDE
jgi:hypothetical protein